MNVTAPTTAPTTTYYPNGQKQSEFTPNGLGGQAGTCMYYDDQGRKLLCEQKSVDGHTGFEKSFNKDGTTFSTTVTAPNGKSSTTVYGSPK
jgi:antitoxin component YwqK of YwqJK toxin-antitoxin module